MHTGPGHLLLGENHLALKKATMPGLAPARRSGLQALWIACLGIFTGPHRIYLKANGCACVSAMNLDCLHATKKKQKHRSMH